MTVRIDTGAERQRQTGACVLWASQNWNTASWLLRLRAMLFGECQRIEHLGKLFILMWLDDVPYLVHLREAR